MRLTPALSAMLLTAGIAAAQPKVPKVALPVGHMWPITAAGFSPDGALVVTGSEDGSVILWDARSGELLRRWLNSTFEINSVGFLGGPGRIISASFRGSVVIWDSGTGAVLRELDFKREGIWKMAFSRDGKRVFAALDKEGDVAVLDGTTGERLRTLKGFGPVAQNSIQVLTASPDGSRLFARSERGEWAIWNTELGARLDVQRPERLDPAKADAATFGRDGKSLFVACGASVTRWDYDRAMPALTVKRLLLPVMALDSSGRYALAGMYDAIPFRVVDCEEGGGKELEGVKWVQGGKELEGVKWAQAACFSEDGSKVLVASNKQRPDGPVNVEAGIWEAKSGKSLQRLRATVRAPGVLRLSGTRLTVADLTGAAAEWDLATSLPPRAARIEGALRADEEATTPDGRFTVKLESGGIGNKAALHVAGEAGRRKRFEAGKDDSINSVAISADGRLVVTCMFSNQAILWDATTAARVHKFQAAGDYVFAIAISADGKQVVTGMASGKLVVWDTASGKQLKSFAAHAVPVWVVAMTPDARRILTAADDGTTRIWDAATGAELVRLVSFNDGNDWLVMTPDGRFDGSPAALKLAKFRTDGRLKLEPIETRAKELRRPGLLAEVWKGTKSSGK